MISKYSKEKLLELIKERIEKIKDGTITYGDITNNNEEIEDLESILKELKELN